MSPSFSYVNRTGRPFLMGHRGAMELFPENTLVSIKGAIEMGCEIVEFDVQLSADGRAMVIHDDTVNRTTDGRGNVHEMSFDALRRLDAGRTFDERFAGERIPTLDEVLSLAAPTRACLNIEIKNGPVFAEGIEKAVADAVAGHGMSERVIISSFDHESLFVIKNLAPKLVTAPLVVSRMHDVPAYLRHLKADGYHPRWNYVTKKLVAELHAAGFFLNTWIVQDREIFDTLSEWGVDAIGVNNPRTFAAA